MSTLHYTLEAARFPHKSHKECLASSEFIQSGGVGMMDPECTCGEGMLDSNIVRIGSFFVVNSYMLYVG